MWTNNMKKKCLSLNNHFLDHCVPFAYFPKKKKNSKIRPILTSFWHFRFLFSWKQLKNIFFVVFLRNEGTFANIDIHFLNTLSLVTSIYRKSEASLILFGVSLLAPSKFACTIADGYGSFFERRCSPIFHSTWYNISIYI